MKRHTIVVGLGFGDESKGATVDHLCATQDVTAVVRFSGGPQTLHHVISPTGEVHGFSQFGSGTFRGVSTLHSRFSLINPFNMSREAEHLEELGVKDPFSGVWFDKNCLVITPLHRALNQAQEIARGDARHGSCGQGVGVAQQFALEHPEFAPRMSDIRPTSRDFSVLSYKLAVFHAWARRHEPTVDDFITQYEVGLLTSQYMDWTRDVRPLIISTEEVTKMIKSSRGLVFEGTQGVLLDEWYGFHPHTTWSTTTFENAETLLTEAGFTRDQWTRLGLTRSYTTRHGAGPLPGEDETLLPTFPELHNGTGRFQGSWRVSPFDFELFEYAIDVVDGVDEIGVSHLDYIPRHGGMPALLHYDNDTLFLRRKLEEEREDLAYQESLTRFLESVRGDATVMHLEEDELIRRVEIVGGAPVTLEARGPSSEDRVYTPRSV